MRALTVFILAGVHLAGCARAGPPARCAWPAEAPSALDLQMRSSRRHLNDDALRAEDIGIRYADGRNAPHSGHFEGFASYNRTTDSCITAMLSVVARTHGVAPDTVRASLTHRPVAGDALVMLSFATLFALVADVVTRRVNRNFPLDGGRDSVVAVAAIIITSFLVSGVAVMLGEWFAISVEVIRVGSGHLSYRTQRIPWTHHRTELFLAGVALFCVVAALRHQIGLGSEADHATRWGRRPARRSAATPLSSHSPTTRVDRR